MTVKMALSSNEEYNLDQEVIFVQLKYWKTVEGKNTNFDLFEKLPSVML